MEELNPRKAIRLRNRTCPYCGELLAGRSYNAEHVIGRRFVPKGKLHQSWNLILLTCTDCNSRKGQLEDDLSAVTMQPTAFGEFATEDPILWAESARKGAGSRDRSTGKSINESWTTKEWGGSVGLGFTFTANFNVPPQVQINRVLQLAHLQLTALFYWLTYNPATERGGFWIGDAVAINSSFKRDWGNNLQVSFMGAVSTWEHRLHVIAADGFFKAVIRRHPDAECWAWGLEWNHNLRLIGLFGDPNTIQGFTPRLKPLSGTIIPDPDGTFSRLRAETPLAEDEDVLFVR